MKQKSSVHGRTELELVMLGTNVICPQTRLYLVGVIKELHLLFHQSGCARIPPWGE